MTDTRYHLPHEVANQLLISPSTLRRWSTEFSDFLSDLAGRSQGEEDDRTSHRRYTDQDVETLLTIKGLLAEGLTYIQVGRRLEARRKRQANPGRGGEDADSQATTLGLSVRESPMAPAMTVLADTLHTMTEGQQLLLGSQQANRELLTVVIQDNFSLKDENTKLRDRMLVLERDVVEMRRVEDRRRENLEDRLSQLEEIVRPQKTQTKQNERSGCLGQLLGL